MFQIINNIEKIVQYSNANIADIEEQDEATATRSIIEKALAEAAFESKFGDTDDLDNVKSDVSTFVSKLRHFFNFHQIIIFRKNVTTIMMMIWI